MTNSPIVSRFGLVLLVFGFIFAVSLNQWLFRGVRVDLTENQLYSLSDGTHKILKEIDEPINLYFFYSETGFY